MIVTPDSIVQDVVKFNFKTARLFQARKIDYCCDGDRPIADACMRMGVNPGQLIRDLESIIAQKDPDMDYIINLTLNGLANYIVKRHHSFVRSYIPYIKKNLEKLCKVYGENHSELHKIRELFFGSAQDLFMHLLQEEIVLFPIIKELESTKNENIPVDLTQLYLASNSIAIMIEEHQQQDNRFKEISRLSENYQVPDDGCITYEITLKQLSGFEDDLCIHIHLENNILFAKTLALAQD